MIAYCFPRTIRPSQLLPEVSIIVLTWNLRKPRGTEDMTGTKSWVVIALGYLRHNSHALFSLRSSECASVDDFLGVISILMHKWHLYKHQEKESHMPGIANSSASWTRQMLLFSEQAWRKHWESQGLWQTEEHTPLPRKAVPSHPHTTVAFGNVAHAARSSALSRKQEIQIYTWAFSSCKSLWHNSYILENTVHANTK